MSDGDNSGISIEGELPEKVVTSNVDIAKVADAPEKVLDTSAQTSALHLEKTLGASMANTDFDVAEVNSDTPLRDVDANGLIPQQAKEKPNEISNPFATPIMKPKETSAPTLDNMPEAKKVEQPSATKSDLGSIADVATSEATFAAGAAAKGAKEAGKAPTTAAGVVAGAVAGAVKASTKSEQKDTSKEANASKDPFEAIQAQDTGESKQATKEVKSALTGNEVSGQSKAPADKAKPASSQDRLAALKAKAAQNQEKTPEAAPIAAAVQTSKAPTVTESLQTAKDIDAEKIEKYHAEKKAADAKEKTFEENTRRLDSHRAAEEEEMRMEQAKLEHEIKMARFRNLGIVAEVKTELRVEEDAVYLEAKGKDAIQEVVYDTPESQDLLKNAEGREGAAVDGVAAPEKRRGLMIDVDTKDALGNTVDASGKDFKLGDSLMEQLDKSGLVLDGTTLYLKESQFDEINAQVDVAALAKQITDKLNKGKPQSEWIEVEVAMVMDKSSGIVTVTLDEMGKPAELSYTESAAGCTGATICNSETFIYNDVVYDLKANPEAAMAALEKMAEETGKKLEVRSSEADLMKEVGEFHTRNDNPNSIDPEPASPFSFGEPKNPEISQAMADRFTNNVIESLAASGVEFNDFDRSNLDLIATGRGHEVILGNDTFGQNQSMLASNEATIEPSFNLIQSSDLDSKKAVADAAFDNAFASITSLNDVAPQTNASSGNVFLKDALEYSKVASAFSEIDIKEVANQGVVINNYGMTGGIDMGNESLGGLSPNFGGGDVAKEIEQAARAEQAASGVMA